MIGLSEVVHRWSNETFLFHDKLVSRKLSEQNDYQEVVKIPEGCHGLLECCNNVVSETKVVL